MSEFKKLYVWWPKCFPSCARLDLLEIIDYIFMRERVWGNWSAFVKAAQMMTPWSPRQPASLSQRGFLTAFSLEKKREKNQYMKTKTTQWGHKDGRRHQGRVLLQCHGRQYRQKIRPDSGCGASGKGSAGTSGSSTSSPFSGEDRKDKQKTITIITTTVFHS